MKTRRGLMHIRVFAFCIIILFLAGFSACESAPQGGLSDSSQSTAPPISDEAVADSSSEPAAGGIAPEPYIPSTVSKTADGHTVAAAPYESYPIPLDPSWWWMGENHALFVDRNGNIIPEDKQFEVLYDVLSGEPQCLTLTKNEIIGRDAEAYPVTRTLSALYDLDGNLLCDWDYYSYRAGFGDFVIRQKSMDMASGYAPIEEVQYSSELWDFRQDRSLIAQVWQAERLDEGKILLCDERYRPLTVVGEDARVLAQNTVEDYFNVRVWNGYMIAANGSFEERNIGDVLLSPEFAPLMGYDDLQTGASERTLLYRRDYANNFSYVTRSGLVTREGKEILQIPSEHESPYFDDELMVLSNGPMLLKTGPNETERYRLVRIADGEVLAEDFENFGYVTDYQNNIWREFFACYRDGTLYLLDRDGKSFARREIPDASGIDYMGEGYIKVSTEIASGYYRDSVFDTELNEIIPAGTYTNIRRASGNVAGREPLYYDIFICSRSARADDTGLYDIVDSSGNVLISGLNQVYSTGPDRHAVRKGFDVGLMDWSGEWVVKRSVFSELQD